jgi:hypothetical protein
MKTGEPGKPGILMAQRKQADGALHPLILESPFFYGIKLLCNASREEKSFGQRRRLKIQCGFALVLFYTCLSPTSAKDSHGGLSDPH